MEDEHERVVVYVHTIFINCIIFTDNYHSCKARGIRTCRCVYWYKRILVTYAFWGFSSLKHEHSMNAFSWPRYVYTYIQNGRTNPSSSRTYLRGHLGPSVSTFVHLYTRHTSWKLRLHLGWQVISLIQLCVGMKTEGTLLQSVRKNGHDILWRH